MAKVQDYMIMTAALRGVDVDRILRHVAEQHQQDIVDMNREQLDAGIDANGDALPMPYAPKTIEIKQAKGQPTDRITLEDRGDFKNRMKVNFRRKYFEVTSRDWKTPVLKKEWGDDIFGLTKENKEDLAQWMKLDVIRLMRDSLSIRK